MSRTGLIAGHRQCPLPTRLLVVWLLVVPLLTAVPFRHGAAFELFWIDNNSQVIEVTGSTGSCPSPPKSRPVLFVHGHPLDGSSSSTPSYQRNWVDGTSFNLTLGLNENQGLDIQDYYIEFQVRDRSILEDANKIGQAIGLIQDCQNSSNPSDVKVAVVAYSKGTISTRLYLRSRHAASLGQDLSSEFPGDVPLIPHSPATNPVSEFIALAAPNHGLRAVALIANELPIQQLNNGRWRAAPCLQFTDPRATDFMSRLNGLDSNGDWSGAHETPASRANGDAVANGTLYVSIYDNNDAVGGDLPDANDCATPKRKQAFNRGTNAENIRLNVAGASALDIHINTVKDTEIICRALYIVVHQRVPPTGSTPICETTPAGLPIIPDGTGAILALDHSGSMGISACPTCGPKQVVLRDAATIFLATWEALAKPKDKIGIAYFRTNVSQFTATGSGDTLVHVLPDTSVLAADLQAEAETSSGLTAMGGALQAGILELQGVSGLLRGVGPNRHVILFTDGLQNVNPKILDDANQNLIIDNVAGFVDAGIPVLLSHPVAEHGVTVDTIGIGVNPISQSLLQDLSLETGGISYFSTDTNLLSQFFTMTLMDTLRDSSPQLIAYRYGTLGQDEQVEAFVANSGARQIVLRLSWPHGDDLSFRVEKDGIDLTAAGDWIESDFYKIFTMDLPASVAGNSVQPGGEWRMVVRGHPGVAYEAAAIVDEPQINYRVAIGGGPYAVGQPLELEARLGTGEYAVEQVRVTASVMRPTDSIGNLLAAYPSTAAPATMVFEPLTTVGQRAAQAALQDEQIWRRLQPATEAITLSADDTGTYRASFPETTIPGIYTVTYEIEVEGPELGIFRRMHSVSTQVRVASAEFESSGVTVEILAQTERGREAVLRLTPQDRFGNFYGPDHGHAIGLQVSAGTSQGAVRDLGNGTYAIPLILPKEGSTEVTITVAGKELFAGSVTNLETPADRSNLTLWFLLVLGWTLVLVLITWRLVVRRAP